MAVAKSRVNEEKMMNDMFVLLEYSDSIKEFVAGLTKECKWALVEALDSAVWEIIKDK